MRGQGPRLAWFARAWLKRPSRRRGLLQADVRSVFVVIGDIFTPLCLLIGASLFKDRWKHRWN